MTIAIVRASEQDIGSIMCIERLPGYDRFIATWSRAEHRRCLAEADNVYWLARRAGKPENLGFAIVTGVNEPHAGPCLHRIALSHPGEGNGRNFVMQLVSWAFEELKTHRFWLEVFPHNVRAKTVYERCGFVQEGVLRNSYRLSDGTRADRIVMSILASEYEPRVAV